MRWRLLDGVPDEEVRRLLSIARRRRFSRNEVVFHRDDPADSLHLVSKGRFAIRIMTPLGDTVTIGIRVAGDSFGEMALVAEGMKRSATVEALEEAETFAVYVAEFERLRGKHPSVNQVLIAFLAGEVRRQNELLLEAGTSRATVNRVLRDEQARGTVELRGRTLVLDADEVARRAREATAESSADRLR